MLVQLFSRNFLKEWRKEGRNKEEVNVHGKNCAKSLLSLILRTVIIVGRVILSVICVVRENVADASPNPDQIRDCV